VDVLRNMVDAARPGGVVLDLQVIRPNARVEVDGRFICEIGGEVLFGKAAAATAAVDAAIAAGRLVEEAVDDHDVLKHYPSGADLLADLDRRGLSPVDEAALPRLGAIVGPCVTRERCRLRRLRLPGPASRDPGSARR